MTCVQKYHKAPFGPSGVELGYRGVLQGKVDLHDFLCGETGNSEENTRAGVGSPSSLANAT